MQDIDENDNNKENLAKYVILHTVLHLAGIAVQEGILEEKLCHPRLLAPVVHWRYVFINVLEDRGVLTVPAYKGIPILPPCETVNLSLKVSKPAIGLDSL